MTVSMRVMSAGDGYKYLLRTVAAGDGDRSLSTPLTRYYAEAGTPPGRWLGSGVAALGNGELTPGAQVSEAQLQLVVGMGRDPITGVPLGRAYPVYSSTADRVADRVAQLDPALGVVERGRMVAQIEVEEAGWGSRRAVAGFDFTFSVPKSASVLWAVADAGTQALIAQAHHEAVAAVVAFMEREVAATRTGVTAGDGAVAQVDVTGLIATASASPGSPAHAASRTPTKAPPSRPSQATATRSSTPCERCWRPCPTWPSGGGRPGAVNSASKPPRQSISPNSSPSASHTPNPYWTTGQRAPPGIRGRGPGKAPIGPLQAGRPSSAAEERHSSLRADPPAIGAALPTCRERSCPAFNERRISALLSSVCRARDEGHRPI